MAAATSSNTSTLQMKHPSIEHTRKRIDPRRRQAALSFLSNISLDGRPVQDDADNHSEEESSLEPRTRHSLVSPERSAYGAAAPGAGAAATAAAAAAAAAAATTAAQALAFANQALLSGSRTCFGTGPAAAPAADGEGDAFLPSSSAFSSPFSGVPASARGRLQTYTQGILPASYSRQSSQNYCLEGGQIANSAIELQRSRDALPSLSTSLPDGTRRGWRVSPSSGTAVCSIRLMALSLSEPAVKSPSAVPTRSEPLAHPSKLLSSLW